jgi:tryptophan synthase alpha chain
VALRGVTGARKSTPKDIQALVKAIKRKVKTPVLIGFGVSSAAQAVELSRFSDGVIVGSALIEKIRTSNFRIDSAVSYMRQMVNAVQSVR